MEDHHTKGEQSVVNAIERRRVEMERTRAGVSALVFVGFAVVGSLGAAGAPEVVRAQFTNGLPTVRIAALFLAAGAFMWAARLRLTALLKRGGGLQRYHGLMLSFIEVCLLMALLVVGATAMVSPIDSLYSPLPFMLPLVVGMTAVRLDEAVCWATGALAGLLYLAAAWWLVSLPSAGLPPAYSAVQPHVMRALIIFSMGPVAAVTTRVLRSAAVSAVERLEERNAISRVFGQHVSPKLVDRLLERPFGDDTEMRFVCLMFVDIRRFTELVQEMPAEDVVTLLNQLFGFMIAEVNKHNGMINKFLGDGFLAVFGAPLSDGDDVLNAVRAAEAILAKLDERLASGEIPPIEVGIGLHAGEAITGSVGSVARKEYTIIGDAVNLASRIEGLNRSLESRLLVSEAVWDQLGRDQADVTVHEHVVIRGRVDTEKLYQLA